MSSLVFLVLVGLGLPHICLCPLKRHGHNCLICNWCIYTVFPSQFTHPHLSLLVFLTVSPDWVPNSFCLITVIRFIINTAWLAKGFEPVDKLKDRLEAVSTSIKLQNSSKIMNLQWICKMNLQWIALTSGLCLSLTYIIDASSKLYLKLFQFDFKKTVFERTEYRYICSFLFLVQ